MKQVLLPATQLRVSRFIFGTASLFNAGSSATRQRLLQRAVELGFSHFDTAPYYGFGMAERDLAPVLRAHPQLSFTTKVGLYPPGGAGQGAAQIFLRKAIGRAVPSLSRVAVDFSLARARESLEGSLRRTGRERVDLFTLHEPRPELLAADEWLRWLQECVVQGRVRHFGIALTADQAEPFLASRSPLAQVVQLGDSLDLREADLLARHGRPLQITYGYVSAAARRDGGQGADRVLAAALARNRSGAVIVSSTRLERLAQYPRLAAEAPP